MTVERQFELGGVSSRVFSTLRKQATALLSASESIACADVSTFRCGGNELSPKKESSMIVTQKGKERCFFVFLRQEDKQTSKERQAHFRVCFSCPPLLWFLLTHKKQQQQKTANNNNNNNKQQQPTATNNNNKQQQTTTTNNNKQQQQQQTTTTTNNNHFTNAGFAMDFCHLSTLTQRSGDTKRNPTTSHFPVLVHFLAVVVS